MDDQLEAKFDRNKLNIWATIAWVVTSKRLVKLPRNVYKCGNVHQSAKCSVQKLNCFFLGGVYAYRGLLFRNTESATESIALKIYATGACFRRDAVHKLDRCRRAATVCPSVCHVRVFCRNECTHIRIFFTVG